VTATRTVSVPLDAEELAELAVLADRLDSRPSLVIRALIRAGHVVLEGGADFEPALFAALVRLTCRELDRARLDLTTTNPRS
jgi:hypothetical protein